MTTSNYKRTRTQSPANETIVAIDLETTGVDPTTDAIIEVGAVKFKGNEELGRFSSVINPHRKLSSFIVDLTGITQDEADRGAEWDRVKPMLAEFIGSYAILGHNVGFDAAFLRNNGVYPKGSGYDTSEMARVVMPTGPEYSLGRLSERFELLHDNPHRALSDALATRDLFMVLLERFESLDVGTLETLRRLGMSSSWSIGPLVSGILESLPSERRKAVTGPSGIDIKALAQRLRGRSNGAGTARTATEAPESGQSPPETLSEAVTQVFGDAGPLSELLPGHESRPEQAEMAAAVADAIEQQANLIVEAGTGVGKSLAYLVPAALHASRTNSRVIVSTNTINLQEQLLNKDLRIVADVLHQVDPSAQPLRSAQLKGRANYLCFRRWSNAVNSTQPDEREAGVLAKLLVWLQETKSGDRSELALGRDGGMFTRFSAQGAAGCPPNEGPCFLRKARSEAASSNVVVINHAMLMSDIAMGGGLLPDHDVLIIDEAHHLQDAATRHLGIAVRQNQLAADLSTATGETGAIAAYGAALRASASGDVALDPVPQMVQETTAATSRAAELANEAFNAISEFAQFVAKHVQGNDIRLTDSVRELPQWAPVAQAGENLVTALGEAAAGMARLLARRDPTNGEDESPAALDLSAVYESITQAHEGLRQAVIEPESGFVYWLSVIGGGRAVEVHGAPLDVSPVLRERLFQRDATVVLTGATLSQAGDFTRITSAIGLDDAGQLSLGSPFDYRQAALIAVPEDITEPGGTGYAQGVAAAIESIAKGVRGRTLALFTSNSALENARKALVESLAPHGIKVVGQGHDGPPHRIMRTLADENDVVALGTSSLWEGADMQGARLDALVMARLPFPVPSDPVFSARNELFEDGFGEYAVPEAVLRFRQGFGRLIRSKTDRGIFVILDRRILTKGYGRSFQRALPKSTVRRTVIEELEDLGRSWKAGGEV